MHRSLPIIAVCLAAVGGAWLGPAMAAPPLKLKAPEGWIVELVAAPPLVEHPLMTGFDERGRLYVADNAGQNLPFEDLDRQFPNSIRRLEDSDGDGIFDRSTVFADRLTFPQGALWHAGSVYTASPPYIWKLTDDDDDGVADRREPIVGRFGSNGNAADIHGCFLGPEGRLWWCDGRHGHELRDRQGNVTSRGLAARIFSARLDGSDVETYCGGGMDNPVEVDFTPAGDVLGPANLFYPIRGDCLVHWVRGGVYPRADDPSWVGEFRRTGALLPDVFDLGHVAVSGTVRVRAPIFGDGDNEQWLVCEFNTHRVCRLSLERSGSTYRAQRHEFVWSDDADVHPTDVLEDADGSLLVIDTGGWFRIGCPTSQIAKPEIGGAIYRIRRADAPPVDDPRGLRLAWSAAPAAELAERLGDGRSAVRERAIDELAARGAAGVPAAAAVLRAGRSAAARLAAVWTLCRSESAAAHEPLTVALADADDDVRQAAASALGTLRASSAVEPLVARLTDEQPAVRRVAAQALGQIGDARAVPSLLAALAEPGDRMLEHALIYALIELDAPRETAAGLAAQSPAVRRAALEALDQMPSGQLTAGTTIGLLATDDRPLAETVVEVVARHPDWSAEVVELLRTALAPGAATPPEQVRSLVGAFCRDAQVQAIVAAGLGDDATSPAIRSGLLESIAQHYPQPLPASWVDAIGARLTSPVPSERAAALAAAVAVTDERLADALRAIALDSIWSSVDRTTAALALGRMGQPLDDALFALLLAHLASQTAPLDRLAAAESLAAARLTPEQLSQLVPHVAAAGPLELAALVRAFEVGGTADLGRAVVDALAAAPGLSSLSSARIAALTKNYPPEVAVAAASLAVGSSLDEAARAARVEAIAGAVREGNPARGKQLFFGAKAACAACHRLGSDGGQIGPDLTHVGRIRAPRDLAESILFPSQSLARGFESYHVQTASGLSYTGLIARQTADAIWLRTAERTERRIARAEIEALTPAATSIMPEGLDRVLTDAELASIVAYLSAAK